jgi:gamma-glutamylcyclotransferase (GGCT)/AIG2-like uncharacterized protein YtfP
VKYFAYGSNMSKAQIDERCPRNRLIGIAKLSNYRLCFPRYSEKRKGGVASISEENGCEVWGVVFELLNEDIARLDRSEGYRVDRDPNMNSYNKISVPVSVNGQLLSCQTYQAVAQGTADFRPSSDYMKLIIVGAREHHLPDEYVKALGNIGTN